jgi:hypothetical protein
MLPGAIVIALLALTLASPSHAQTFSSANLEGIWDVFQISTPHGPLGGGDIKTYTGQVEFDANGVVVGDGSIIVNDQDVDAVYLVSGNFSVSAGAVVTGRLALVNIAGPSGALVVREARLLTTRHTIVGASDLFDQTGLFTLAKRVEGQAFGIADIGGTDTLDWNYHELTPSNQAVLEGAAWVNGVITFHGDAINPGCSVADLVLSDGTIRARRTDGDGIRSFG